MSASFWSPFAEDVCRFKQLPRVSRLRSLVLALSEPGLLAMLLFRLQHAAFLSCHLKTARLIHVLSRLLLSFDVGPGARLAGGIIIRHPVGIVISSSARISSGCELMQGVTIGERRSDDLVAAPFLGEDVFVGAGAVIVGGISIGAQARIGALAFVGKDVPARALAVGVPARVVT